MGGEGGQGGAHRDNGKRERQKQDESHTPTNSEKKRKDHDPQGEYIVGPQRHAQP